MGRWIPVALVVAVAIVLPVLDGNQADVGLATEVVIYGLATSTLNLLIGYGGQVSIGQAGFLAVGAYSAAIIGQHAHYPVVVVIILAGVITGAVGFLLGLPTGRLRGHYLAVATLGFGVAVSQIALNLGSLTGGFNGMVVAPPQLGSFQFTTPRSVYYLSLVVVALCTLAMVSMLATRSGRAFMAVRDREVAAAAMGIAVGRTKIVLFTTSAFFCGIAGSLFAYDNGYVHPADFSFSLSLFFLAAVVVGGLGTLWGPFLGALVLVLIQNSSSTAGGYSEVLIGGAVVLVVLFLRNGIAGIPVQARSFLATRRRGRS